jgi:hypothetical protein
MSVPVERSMPEPFGIDYRLRRHDEDTAGSTAAACPSSIRPVRFWLCRFGEDITDVSWRKRASGTWRALRDGS